MATSTIWVTDTLIVILAEHFKQVDLETYLEVCTGFLRMEHPQQKPLVAEFYAPGEMIVYCHTDRAARFVQHGLIPRHVLFEPANVA